MSKCLELLGRKALHNYYLVFKLPFMCAKYFMIIPEELLPATLKLSSCLFPFKRWRNCTGEKFGDLFEITKIALRFQKRNFQSSNSLNPHLKYKLPILMNSLLKYCDVSWYKTHCNLFCRIEWMVRRWHRNQSSRYQNPVFTITLLSYSSTVLLTSSITACVLVSS